VIVSADDSLTKAHARFLESQLIRATLEADSIRLTNSRAPDFRRLPEADLADMKHFFGQLRMVLPILGFELFRVSAPTGPKDDGSDPGPVFVMTAAGATARAVESTAGFVVLAGSAARRSSSGTFPDGYRALRDGLVSSAQLTQEGSSPVFRFTVDVAFSSPSAAAAIVAGRSASGPLDWTIESTGETYRAWKSAQLA
jgi:hypothetical protein